MPNWIGVWRLNRETLQPERIQVLPVSENFVLVEGEEHTSYKGSFFDSPADAYVAAFAEAARRVRAAQREIERLRKAHENYTSRVSA